MPDSAYETHLQGIMGVVFKIVFSIAEYNSHDSLQVHLIEGIGHLKSQRKKLISIYTLSDLGYSSNLIGSLSRANAALFTRYRVDNALSHKT